MATEISSAARALDAVPGLAAARDGDVAALEALLTSGWRPNTQDTKGCTALMWAAGAGHLDACGTLQPKADNRVMSKTLHQRLLSIFLWTRLAWTGCFAIAFKVRDPSRLDHLDRSYVCGMLMNFVLFFLLDFMSQDYFVSCH